MTKNIEGQSTGRSRLAAVLRIAGDVVRIEDAEASLGISRTQAAKLLSRWAGQGWLRWVGSGVYLPVPIQSLGGGPVLEDPWILVPVLFDPAYVGGRTAAEHWDLTEQIFRDIIVFTAGPVRNRLVKRENCAFTLKKVDTVSIFGTKSVWRSRTKVQVSDVHRTIVDMLNDPSVGGGIQHVSECLAEYVRRRDRDFDTLVEYADRLGNGALFKRLGFLAEKLKQGRPLAIAAKERLTKGNAKLDPAFNCRKLVTRWRLWIPESWQESHSYD